MWVLHAIGRSLGTARSMTWQITWSLMIRRIRTPTCTSAWRVPAAGGVRCVVVLAGLDQRTASGERESDGLTRDLVAVAADLGDAGALAEQDAGT